MKDRGAFRVLVDTYVTEDSGTGIVHQAPYFGEVFQFILYLYTVQSHLADERWMRYTEYGWHHERSIHK